MQDLRIGDILSRAFSILFKNFVPFIVLTAIVYTPVIVTTFLIFQRASAGDFTENDALLAGGAIGLGTFLLNLIASAAVMYGVIQQLRGQHASMGASIAVGLKRLLPVLGTGILMAFAVGVGLLLLIIPGIVLMMMFYVTIPVTVIEHCGPSEALRRSRALTDGYKGMLFWLNVVIGLISFVADKIIELVQEQMPGMAGVIMGLSSSIFFGALGAVVTAIVYHDLRAMKEGVNVEDLVRVFE